MLNVQEYLKAGNTVTSLESIGVFAKYHAIKPYMILDYDMVEASKHKEHPIVKECRGLVLRTDDFSIIHKSFNRFFNLNESSCTEMFDWKCFSTSTKEDGSLLKVRWYENEFFVTTRNSFADSKVGESGKSWAELALGCLTEIQLNFIKAYCNHTFVFELCTPHNTVVVNHPEPKLVLLSTFDFYGDESYDKVFDNQIEYFTKFNVPEYFFFDSLDEVLAYLDKLEENKDDTEGVVLTDCNGVRLKAKSKWYLKLHRLSGNGNIGNQDNLLDIILSGECDEIISYFPYLKEKVDMYSIKLADLFADLYNVWWMCQDFEEQKKFAVYITKENPTPFSSILFHLKRDGKINDEHALLHEWHQSSALILRVLKED